MTSKQTQADAICGRTMDFTQTAIKARQLTTSGISAHVESHLVFYTSNLRTLSGGAASGCCQKTSMPGMDPACCEPAVTILLPMSLHGLRGPHCHPSQGEISQLALNKVDLHVGKVEPCGLADMATTRRKNGLKTAPQSTHRPFIIPWLTYNDGVLNRQGLVSGLRWMGRVQARCRRRLWPAQLSGPRKRRCCCLPSTLQCWCPPTGTQQMSTVLQDQDTGSGKDGFLQDSRKSLVTRQRCALRWWTMRESGAKILIFRNWPDIPDGRHRHWTGER